MNAITARFLTENAQEILGDEAGAAAERAVCRLLALLADDGDQADWVFDNWTTCLEYCAAVALVG